MMTTSELLEKAADLIEEGGLCKGTYFKNNGEHCTLGALRRIASGNDGMMAFAPGYAEAVAALQKEIFGRVMDGRLALAEWNDLPGRTANDVAQTMRKAAKAHEPV